MWECGEWREGGGGKVKVRTLNSKVFFPTGLATF